MFPEGTNAQTSRSLDPETSLEDYNRTMLEYTQRQMSFVDADDRSSSSGVSSRSGSSRNGGVLADQAHGPPLTSASAAAQHNANRRKAAQNSAEAKASGY